MEATIKISTEIGITILYHTQAIPTNQIAAIGGGNKGQRFLHEQYSHVSIA